MDNDVLLLNLMVLITYIWMESHVNSTLACDQLVTEMTETICCNL